jgi:hypothetical protein
MTVASSDPPPVMLHINQDSRKLFFMLYCILNRPCHNTIQGAEDGSYRPIYFNPRTECLLITKQWNLMWSCHSGVWNKIFYYNDPGFKITGMFTPDALTKTKRLTLIDSGMGLICKTIDLYDIEIAKAFKSLAELSVLFESAWLPPEWDIISQAEVEQDRNWEYDGLRLMANDDECQRIHRILKGISMADKEELLPGHGGNLCFKICAIPAAYFRPKGEHDAEDALIEEQAD